MTEIDGRVAVVTGGASGIGQGIARTLADAGARVVIADLDHTQAVRAAEAIGALPVTVDVSDAASVSALAETAIAHFGAVDILVNNAGVGPQAPISEMSLHDWRWLMGVNLWGVIHGVHAFLPHLLSRPRGGHIVNVASMSALAPMPPLGGYAVTKSGVLALTEVLAQELQDARSRVHVTAVAPGPTRTRIAESLRHRTAGDSGGLREFDNKPAPGLWRDPGDVGRAVVEAIRGDGLYVITHPELWPRVAARHRRIAASFGVALPPP
jgi:NAD(P)-dependent dehydrogenase (short-subunit alcohol dehydrogenase family)